MALPEKPKFESPCNHCGLCCKLELCHAAKMAFPNAEAPCPALCIQDDKALCGLVLAEQQQGNQPVIARSLGIGFGCSMPDEDTTQDQVLMFEFNCKLKLIRTQTQKPLTCNAKDTRRERSDTTQYRNGGND